MDAICPSAPQAQAPTGILESTAPVPIPTAPKALEPSNPIYAYKKTGTFRVGFFDCLFDCPYFRTEGSQVAMPGTKQRRAISRIIITAKGAAPTMMS